MFRAIVGLQTIFEFIIFRQNFHIAKKKFHKTEQLRTVLADHLPIKYCFLFDLRFKPETLEFNV